MYALLRSEPMIISIGPEVEGLGFQRGCFWDLDLGRGACIQTERRRLPHVSTWFRPAGLVCLRRPETGPASGSSIMTDKAKKLPDTARVLVILAATGNSCLNTKDDRQTLITQLTRREQSE